MFLFRELVQDDHLPKSHPRAIITHTEFKKVAKQSTELSAFQKDRKRYQKSHPRVIFLLTKVLPRVILTNLELVQDDRSSGNYPRVINLSRGLKKIQDKVSNP